MITMDMQKILANFTLATLFLAGCSNGSSAPLRVHSQTATGTLTPPPTGTEVELNLTTLKGQTPTSKSTPTFLYTPFPTQQHSSFTSIDQVYFVDEQVGWMTLREMYENGSSYSIELRKTVDGGETWANLPGNNVLEDLAYSEYPAQMRFVSEQKGWMFTPGLFTTNDGGISWTDDGFGNSENSGEDETRNMVVSLEIVGDTAWVITRECLPHYQSCSFLLLAQSPLGKWLPLAQQPTIQGLKSWLMADQVGDVWILSSDRNTSYLILTSDGGRTWKPVSLPEIDIFVIDPILQVSQEGALWLMITGATGMVQQDKLLYTSEDKGQSWQLVADTSMFEADRRIGTLPLRGYAGKLDVVTKDSAFLALSKASAIEQTINGGVDWQAALPFDMSVQSAVGVEMSIFSLNEEIYWIWAEDFLFHTLDGGKTWQVIEIPS